MLQATGASVVLGMRPVSPNSIFVGPIAADGRMSAIVDRVRDWQSAGSPPLPPEYTMNGALYLFRWDFFKEHRRLYHDGSVTRGYKMDPHYSVEIDDPIELHLAEFLVEHGHVNMAYWEPTK
jgi:hypothetical protein